VIAEDLGVITPAVTRLRESLGLPGMVVLQFGFNRERARERPRPRALSRGPVLYTGHARQRHAARVVRVAAAVVVELVRAAGVGGREPWWGLMELALSSKPRLCMLQAQDVLGLGSEARMNMPAVAGGQWRWRLRLGL
jgi:4-alpha-glucanotransferase